MGVFNEFATVVYEAYQEMVDWENKVELYKKEEYKAREEREKQERCINDALERKRREQYWKMYWEDPSSVMILPYGWSPFGFYI